MGGKGSGWFNPPKGDHTSKLNLNNKGKALRNTMMKASTQKSAKTEFKTVTKNYLDKLTDKGFEAYIVGGAVRDFIQGIPPSDFDIATSASPDDVANIFEGSDIDFVGKSFGVSIVDGLEIATYRTDTYGGFSDKNITIGRAKSIEEDLARRDFTVNAMAMDSKGNIIDPFGGKNDLKSKTIKFVGNPQDRITEDPNRIIRACRFLSKLDGKFDESTLKAMQDYIGQYGTTHIASERIRKEIFKAMETKKASKFFESLHDIGALGEIFPDIERSFGHEHGGHHTEDVFTHAMIAGDAITPKMPLLKLAGYLHDIGKPTSFDKDEKTFYNHHRIGEEIVRDNLTKLKFSTDEIEYVSSIVRLHMLQKPEDARAVRRAMKKFTDRKVDYKDWLRVRIADKKANLGKKPYTISELKNLVPKFANFKDAVYEVKKLPIDGKDVMDILRLKPSKQVGNVLNSLLDYVVEHGDAVNDRSHLLEKIAKEGNELINYTKPLDLPRE